MALLADNSIICLLRCTAVSHSSPFKFPERLMLLELLLMVKRIAEALLFLAKAAGR